MSAGFRKIVPVEPEIVIPAIPDSRIGRSSRLLRKLVILPLSFVLVTFLMYPAGFIFPEATPLTSLIATICGTAAVAIVVAMMVVTLKLRKALQDVIVESAVEIAPLLQKKYELDVTPYLAQTLISGSSLPLMLGDRVERVRLVNEKDQAVLYQQV